MTALVDESKVRCLKNQELLADTRFRIACTRRHLNPAWAIAGASDDTHPQLAKTRTPDGPDPAIAESRAKAQSTRMSVPLDEGLPTDVRDSSAVCASGSPSPVEGGCACGGRREPSSARAPRPDSRARRAALLVRPRENGCIRWGTAPYFDHAFNGDSGGERGLRWQQRSGRSSDCLANVRRTQPG